ncbi:BRCT domain-containing protein [Sodalis sp. RH24]|uniref:BRCT domain-containing protein n=1 Tax=unclassified Sodalis (in: enterobacteria) TaxID=2636512 RepID=UPI0039B4FCB9
MASRNFIYINAKRIVRVFSLLQVSDSELHIQGICSQSNTLKTFRKDRIIEEFYTLDDALSRYETLDKSQYDHYVTSPKKKPSLLEVCFTGFKKNDKDRLITLAEENKLLVRSSVTQNLQFLCCGYNAGPTKVTAARMKGVIILNEDEFGLMLETGEIPES